MVLFLHIWKRRAKRKAGTNRSPTIGELQAQSAAERLSRDQDENLQRLEELFGGSSDLIVRRFRLGENPNVAAALLTFGSNGDTGCALSPCVWQVAPAKAEVYRARPANPGRGWARN